MHWHNLRSQILQVFEVTSHVVGLFALYFVSSIQFVAVPIYSISDLYANSLYSFTLRKRSCEVLSLHTAVLGVASPRERLPLDQDRGSAEHPPSSVLFGSSAVEMFTGGSVQMSGVPTPQQKAYDVYEHCPVAVVPWLQSQGTQNSPQYGCDVDAGQGSKKRSSALQLLDPQFCQRTGLVGFRPSLYTFRMVGTCRSIPSITTLSRD